MFYGWKLVTIGSLGNFALYGGILYTMNAFTEPLCNLYGWSRASIGLIMSLASLLGTFAMSGSVQLASKIGIRRTMTLGALVGGSAFITLGHTSNIWIFAILYSIVWVCGQMCGGSVANILAGNWFARFRGRALGLVNTGLSLSGAILPLVALVIVDCIGVSYAYDLLGGLVLLLVPLCYVLVRDRPDELGLNRDGRADDVKTLERNRKQNKVPWADFFGNSASWIICVTFATSIMASAGVLAQLKPRFVEIGLSSYPAMICACFTPLFGAIGKVAWGMLSDRMTPLSAARLMLTCNIISLSFILLPPHPVSVGLFVLTYGLSMGGLWVLFPAVIAYYYGADRFYGCYKYASLFILIKSFGYSIVGFSFAFTGSYTYAYIGLIVLMIITMLSFFLIKDKDAKEYKEFIDSRR